MAKETYHIATTPHHMAKETHQDIRVYNVPITNPPLLSTTYFTLSFSYSYLYPLLLSPSLSLSSPHACTINAE